MRFELTEQTRKAVDDYLKAVAWLSNRPGGETRAIHVQALQAQQGAPE